MNVTDVAHHKWRNYALFTMLIIFFLNMIWTFGDVAQNYLRYSSNGKVPKIL